MNATPVTIQSGQMNQIIFSEKVGIIIFSVSSDYIVHVATLTSDHCFCIILIKINPEK